MKYLLFVLLFLFNLSVTSQVLNGIIVKVQDGDTVTLLDSLNQQHKIRLHGIDAPEKGQDFSNKSKDYISSLISGKYVTVETKGKDQYKRILGVIYLGEMNINAQMIRSGYAWNYFYSKDKYYIKLQEEAKNNNIGLWSQPNPIDPYYFRKNKRK